MLPITSTFGMQSRIVSRNLMMNSRSDIQQSVFDFLWRHRAFSNPAWPMTRIRAEIQKTIHLTKPQVEQALGDLLSGQHVRKAILAPNDSAEVIEVFERIPRRDSLFSQIPDVVSRLGEAPYKKERFYFLPPASLQSAKSVLDALQARDRISFLDLGHPTISDPGAYIMYQRYSPNEPNAQTGRWICYAGNHGWSSNYVVVDEERVQRHLLKVTAEDFEIEEVSLRDDYQFTAKTDRFHVWLMERTR